MMMLPVLIAGGGIGGLTLALALARRGIPSRVFEARKTTPDEGAGIQLGPNATRVLYSLGVADALEPHTVAPECIIVNDGIAGRELTRLPLGRWIADRHGAPYWVVHRAALQDVLWSAATTHELIRIEMGHAVDHISEQPNATEVTVGFTNLERATGTVLVGADGMWSHVREHVNPNFRLAYAGVTAARALVPRHQIGSTFAELATEVWLAPSAHVVHYPVDGGSTIAIVAIGVCAEPEGGWSISVEADVIAERFRQMPGPVRELLSVAPAWRQWALFGTQGTLRWRRRRCVLIGDAAHPVLPYLAQGGAMAIEDAFELAAAIADSGDDSADALAAFGNHRQRRVEQVQAASIANGQAYHLDGLAARARNAALHTLPGSLFMRRYDWIYGYRSDGLSARL